MTAPQNVSAASSTTSPGSATTDTTSRVGLCGASPGSPPVRPAPDDGPPPPARPGARTAPPVVRKPASPEEPCMPRP